jgi:geranylgeranyl pyrophosphate synthase
MESVRSTGAEAYGRSLARVYGEKAERALKGVPKSKALLELIRFADDVVERRS